MVILTTSMKGGVFAMINLEVREKNIEGEGTKCVCLVGELDLSNAKDLHDRLIEEISGLDSGCRLILDLEGLDFMDSSGVGVLLGILKALNERNATLAMVSNSPRIKRVINISGLTVILPIFETVEEAAKADLEVVVHS